MASFLLASNTLLQRSAIATFCSLPATQDNARSVMTTPPTIAFIGGGNMAEALIAGIKKNQPEVDILVAEPAEERRKKLENDFAVTCYNSAPALLSTSPEDAILILAVKPQIMPAVLTEISQYITADQLVISIAAGITIDSIANGLKHPNQPIVRCMPNTPALVGKGITGLFASSSVSEAHRQATDNILSGVGQTCWVDTEAALDAVTAISGSGPAYYFLFTEALTDAGVKLGLDEKTARQLAVATAMGAGSLMEHSADPLTELRRRVTSPGGTTERAIASFEAANLRAIVSNAATDAAQRAAELAKELAQ